MSKKLFVGGLSWGTNDDALRAAFEPFGRVLDVRVITDRETGRSRGFGFVTFEVDAEAEKAMEQMNGATVDGRQIRVNEAQERRGGGPGGRTPRGAPRRSHDGHQPEVVRSRGGGRYRGPEGNDRGPGGGGGGGGGGGYRPRQDEGGRPPGRGGGGGRFERRGPPRRDPSIPQLPPEGESGMEFDDRPRRDYQKTKRKKRRPHEDSEWSDGAGRGRSKRRERFDWRDHAAAPDDEEE